MMNNKRITKAVAILLGTAAIVKIAYYEAEMVSDVLIFVLFHSQAVYWAATSSNLVLSSMISIK